MTVQDIGDIPMSELKHYGVKGMKWGVRRTPEQLGRARAKKAYKKANRKANRAKRKFKRTDAALQEKIEWEFGTIASGAGLMSPYKERAIKKLQASDKSFRKSKMTQEEIDKMERVAINKALVATAAKGAAASALVIAGAAASTKFLGSNNLSEKQAATAAGSIVTVLGGLHVSDIKDLVETRIYIDDRERWRDQKRTKDRLKREADKRKREWEELTSKP